MCVIFPAKWRKFFYAILRNAAADASRLSAFTQPQFGGWYRRHGFRRVPNSSKEQVPFILEK
jgi:hypothetical protein